MHHDPPDQAPYVPPRGPSLTVDCIVELPTETGELGVLLVHRRFPPHGWALPGGYVDAGESCEEAALRELLEETRLYGRLRYQLRCYSDPRRDPRRATATVAFAVDAEGVPVAGDDAGALQVWPWHALPTLCFDHAQILADYRSGRYVPRESTRQEG